MPPFDPRVNLGVIKRGTLAQEVADKLTWPGGHENPSGTTGSAVATLADICPAWVRNSEYFRRIDTPITFVALGNTILLAPVRLIGIFK